MKLRLLLLAAVLLCPRDSIADESPFIITPQERAAIVKELARRADIIDQQSELIDHLERERQRALLRSTCT